MSDAKPKTLHIGYGGNTVPIPVTFYLSPELMADETYTSDTLADLLKRDLSYAIKHHREARIQLATTTR